MNEVNGILKSQIQSQGLPSALFLLNAPYPSNQTLNDLDQGLEYGKVKPMHSQSVL